MGILLEIDTLSVHYKIREGEVKAVEEAVLNVERGNAVAIVGESGCGKTTLAHTIIRLLPSNAVVKRGEIKLNGVSILEMPEEEFRNEVRWRKVSYVPQGSFNALNPVIKVSNQIAEALTSHGEVDEEEARARSKKLLNLVGIKDEMADAYPHELSGGMKQRTVIAMALACEPELLIADEPTTALDVIVQAQIISLLKSLIERLDLSLILITHDISLATSICDQTVVMYAGNMMEMRDSKDFIETPLQPYSKLLIETLPRMSGAKKNLVTISGSLPDLRNPPLGCKFHPRCPFARRRCRVTKPSLKALKGGGYVACHYPLDRGAIR